MYRATLRASPRLLRTRPTKLVSSTRTFSNPSSASRGTWKGTGLRWGLALAAVYWYNTSPIFADEPAPRTIPEPPQFSDSDLHTVDAVIDQRRHKQSPAAAPLPRPESTQAPQQPASEARDTIAVPVPEIGSPEALEEEAGQQGAFDPETGEINWDCPCLGGMADGPCGEQFKMAFSCFVYSKEEPKGMDCIDKFQHMQDCFRKHPDIYGAELQDDDDGAENISSADEGAPAAESPVQAATDQTAAYPMAARSGRTADSGHDLGSSDGGRQSKITKKAADGTVANKSKEQRP